MVTVVNICRWTLTKMEIKMEQQSEIWKDVEGYEGSYQISNHGRIKSFLESKSGKILSATNKTGWYVSVRLAKNGALKTGRIHKLVEERLSLIRRRKGTYTI